MNPTNDNNKEELKSLINTYSIKLMFAIVATLACTSIAVVESAFFIRSFHFGEVLEGLLMGSLLSFGGIVGTYALSRYEESLSEKYVRKLYK